MAERRDKSSGFKWDGKRLTFNGNDVERTSRDLVGGEELLGFSCSEDDWLTPETQLHKALAQFSQHVKSEHVTQPGAHILHIYNPKPSKKK